MGPVVGSRTDTVMNPGTDSLTNTDMDLPIIVRTREKLVLYVAWSVIADTDSRIIEVDGAIKHIPGITEKDTSKGAEPKGLMRKMKEAELMLLGAIHPNDYVVDSMVVPKNSIVIIEDLKRMRCGIATSNHEIVSDNYVIENVAEIECPTYKELAEMAIHLKALGYRLNAFTYKYDLTIIALLKKYNLIQLE